MSEATDDLQQEMLLGTPIHAVDYENVVASVIEWIRNRKRPPSIIVQANVYSLVNAIENPSYLSALRNADLVVADGMPLIWMLRHKGHPVKNRVYGPDIMLLLCEAAAKYRWRVFLFGGKPEVADRLKENLLRRFPNLIIVGVYSPPFRDLTESEDEEICARINDVRPDLVWVGLGSPKQDLWMEDHRERLNVSVLHGVGAAFDFLSGTISQAPRWMMKAGLEWLYRLYQEPGRLWKRYSIANVKFLYYLVFRRTGGS